MINFSFFVVFSLNSTESEFEIRTFGTHSLTIETFSEHLNITVAENTKLNQVYDECSMDGFVLTKTTTKGLRSLLVEKVSLLKKFLQISRKLLDEVCEIRQ